MWYEVILFSLVLVSCEVKAANRKQDMQINNDIQAVVLRQLKSNMLDTGIFELILNSLSTKNMETSSNVTISFSCLNDTEMVKDGILSRQLYALQFLDSQAKPPHGVLQGKWYWEGDYQECINIQSPYNSHTKHKFGGKYYSARIRQPYLPVNFPLGLVIGVCLPDSCDKEDAISLVNMAFAAITKSNDSVVVLNVYTSDNFPWTDSSLVGSVISALIVIMVLVGTLVDFYDNQYNDGKNNNYMNGTLNGHGPHLTNEPIERTGLLSEAELNDFKTPCVRTRIADILKTFSFFSNTKKLMNTSTAKGPLACLNGLRVISMFWVIQGHTYEFTETVMANSVFAMPTLAERFSFQPIINGTYSVDTFFFLSGLLVAYFALREMSEKGRLNWFYYFGHRYWRLTPVYAFVLLIFATLFPLSINGPFQWIAGDPDGPIYSSVHECYQYWWANLLYINNLYPNYGSESYCMGWTWYLANDMQFYVFLSPIVLILLHKWRKVGIAFSVFLIAGCVAARGFIVHYYGMNQFNQITKHTDDPWGKQGLMYHHPYTRWSVYIVGMLTGFVLQTTNFRIRLNKLYTTIGWCVSTATGLSVIYGLYYYHHNPGSVMSSVGTGFYLSLGRTAWALALAWLVVACASGRGGWVNAILSWKLWAPLGRLTYCAYLVHPLILVGYDITVVTLIQFTDLLYVYLFIGNVVLSYAAAFVVSMAVEAPMMQLEKLILKKQK